MSDDAPVDRRNAWSAAGGVVFAMAGTNAVAWVSGATAAHSPLPLWPVFAFGGLAACGLYCLVAPLVPLWPFRPYRSVAESLDDYIRSGRDARERIVRDGLKPLDAAGVGADWTWRTANGLHERFPAILDEFLLAGGSDQTHPGRAHLIETVDAKLAVLAKARKGLGG